MQMKELEAGEGWFTLVPPVLVKTNILVQSQRSVCKVLAQIEPAAPGADVEYGFLFPTSKDLFLPWITIELPENNGLYFRNMTENYTAVLAQR